MDETEYEKLKQSMNRRYNDYRNKKIKPNEVYDIRRENRVPITDDEFLDFYQLERLTTGDFRL